MHRYLFVESNPPLGSTDTRVLRDALRVVETGRAEVTVGLVEGGVMAAVTKHPVLDQLGANGAEIGVDAFSLAQWGFGGDDVPKLSLTTMEWLLDRMLDANSTVVWH